MAHETHKHLRAAAHRQSASKMSAMGLASGGMADQRSDERMIRSAVAQHEQKDHAGQPLTKIKFRKEGGAAEGGMARPRNDRPGRAAGGGMKKGSKGHGAHVNVIVAPQGGGHSDMMPPGGAAPMPPIHPAGPPAPPPMPPPPPPGMGGPPGMAPPGMMPPGGMPPRPPMPAPGGIPAHKYGGAVGRKMGGPVGDNASTEESRLKEKLGPHNRKRGGGVMSFENKTPSGVGVGEIGAGGGLGRLAKAKQYGEPEGDGEGKLRRGGRA